jgi:hypothetical protein
LGVCFQLVAWIEDFLRERHQTVAVEGASSKQAKVTSGVPQCSVLVPTLFLFYINDLPEEVHSTVRLFADDTIIYNSSKHHSTLQDDLAKLEDWE